MALLPVLPIYDVNSDNKRTAVFERRNPLEFYTEKSSIRALSFPFATFFVMNLDGLRLNRLRFLLNYS